MALTITPQANPLGATLVQQTAASATPNNNVLGAAGTLYMVEVDNAANVAAVYVKLFNNAAPTVGTTPADEVYMCPAGVARVWAIPQGVSYSVAVSLACVTGAAEASTTSPPNPVVVRLLGS